MQQRLDDRTAGVPDGAVAHTGGQPSIPTGNFGPAPRVQDGSAEQAAVIRKAVTEGRRMAAVGLGVLRAGTSSERDRQLLETHFHTTDAAELAKANTVLTSTLTGMNGELPIQVEATSETPKGDATGYVYGGLLASWSDIHLTPRFFGKSPQDQGASILHESTHKFGGTKDHAYAGGAKYRTLAAEMALGNADSYAEFCQGHLAARVDIEDAEQEQRAEEAARTHGEEVWAAWEAGKLAPGTDGFTTSAGVAIPSGLVKEIVLSRFAERYPERYQDLVKHLEAHTGDYRALTCGDGYRASEALVRMIADEERL